LGLYTNWELLRHVYGLEEQSTDVETAVAEHGQEKGERSGMVGGNGKRSFFMGASVLFAFIRRIRDWWFGRGEAVAYITV
jgi:hypothetical protein